MSYTCHIWDRHGKPAACGVAHRTQDAAMDCRIRAKGEEPLCRWEIRGGAFTVAKGAGPTGRTCGGGERVRWEHCDDYATGSTTIRVWVDERQVFHHEWAPGRVPKPSHAEGMAWMMEVVLKSDPDGMAELIRAFNAEDEQDEEVLPANVVRGPWK